MAFLSKISDAALMLLAYPVVLLYFYACNNSESAYIREADKRAKQQEKAVRTAMVERKKLEPKTLKFEHPDIASTIPSITASSKPSHIFSSFTSYRPTQLSNKQKSRLLKLPFELREQILIEVLGNRTLHITQLPKRLGHVRCTRSSTDFSHVKVFCGRDCFNPDKPIQTYHHGEFLDHEGTSDDSLSLLRTCRQVYQESSTILYETNRFDINHPQTLLLLARTIRPSRLAAIKHLNLTWSGVLPFIERDAVKGPDDLETWEETWRITGHQMSGLRSLKMRMLIRDDERERSRSGPFLKYARKRWTGDGVQFEKLLGLCKENVRGLRQFRLGIEMPEEVEWDVGELEERIATSVCVDRMR